MVESTKPCHNCGDEYATYLMTVQEYDPHRGVPESMRIYWCVRCRKESRYPESLDPKTPTRPTNRYLGCP
jgi:DNA-directed RNA polymerase subunit RPC12/RpoP